MPGCPSGPKDGRLIAFIDLHSRRPAYVKFYNDDKVLKISNELLIKTLLRYGVEEVYVEPSNITIIQELSRYFKVYILKKNIRELRATKGLKKADETDVRILEEIYFSDNDAYTIYLPRHIPKDLDVSAYEKLTKVIVQLKNMGADKDLIMEINKIRRRLARRITRRYRDVIDLFNDVRGLGGVSLIHFLMSIPQLTSFKSLNSFLRYLGIKSSKGNKRAKAILYRIALQMKRNGYKGYSITKIQRLAAKIIYQRLREKG